MSAPLHKPEPLIGTAGWSVPAQYAERFGAGDSHLERYATRFNAVEINSSFYRPHQRATYERWARSVPEHFRFAVKFPKAVTHELRLTEYDDLLDRFIDEAGGLGSKLGVVLVQLPPSLEFDGKIAAGFFSALRARLNSTHTLIACEPRHLSWFTKQAGALLEEERIARVAADPRCTPSAGEPGGWRGLIYYRLHGSPRMYYSKYDDAMLDALRPKLAAYANKIPTWCIFDNTAAQAATENALALRSSVSDATHRGSQE